MENNHNIWKPCAKRLATLIMIIAFAGVSGSRAASASIQALPILTPKMLEPMRPILKTLTGEDEGKPR